MGRSLTSDRFMAAAKKHWPPVFLAGCYVYLICATWFRWGDLLVDTFRDPLAAKKILGGLTLYRDIVYEYGPLVPYAMAGLFKISGYGINTMIGIGLTLSTALVLVLYEIARFFLKPLMAVLTVFTFLFTMAFSSSVFNVIIPYSYASLTFITLVAFALYSFILFLNSSGRGYACAWGFFVALAVLTRVDSGLMAWAAFIPSCVLFFIKKKEMRRLIVFMLALTFAVPACVYLLFVQFTGAYAGFMESIPKLIIYARDNPYIKTMLGTDVLARNLWFMLKSFSFQVGYVAMLWIAASLITDYFRKRGSAARLAGGTFLIAAVFLLGREVITYDQLQFRPLPVIAVAGSFIAGRRVLKYGLAGKEMELFALFTVSAVLMIRIFFNAMPIGYGFYLMDTGLVCYYLAVQALCGKMTEFGGAGGSKKLFIWLVAVFFAYVSFSWWLLYVGDYRRRQYRMSTEAGSFTCEKDYVAIRIWQAIQFIRSCTPKDAKVIVVPEGGGISFFSLRDNPLRYYCLMPQNFDMKPEKEYIKDFEDTKADYIVIVQRTTYEMGKGSFGIDYAAGLHEWIRDNYELEKLFGPYPFVSEEVGIAVFKRPESGTEKAADF